MSATAVKPPKFDLAQIRGFWAEQAQQHGTSHAASWSDSHVIDLEIAKIAEYLEAGDRVLDIGCANGFSTIQLAQRASIHIQGLDYVPEMICQARERLTTVPDSVRSRTSFDVGDITGLDVTTGSFDKTIVIRVVINLENWENQQRGLREAMRTVRPGGLLLLSEATIQGHQKLNAFRSEWGLGPIPEPAFNCYLDEDAVCKVLDTEAELVEIANFASTYFVGTRVIKPLIAQLVNRDQVVADPDTDWNRWFATLPAAGDYGTQKLFVFRKRTP
ncbi:MAG TPA: class I SAM-dependent methyltransferase [Pirellulales bacterium]|nr:class I SAM-dependent methyltransferase [Pirellulales bacterium]